MFVPIHNSFPEPPEKKFWGGVLATFQDPCGNSAQIVELPAAAWSAESLKWAVRDMRDGM
jgi:hypothetical protein